MLTPLRVLFCTTVSPLNCSCWSKGRGGNTTCCWSAGHFLVVQTWFGRRIREDTEPYLSVPYTTFNNFDRSRYLCRIFFCMLDLCFTMWVFAEHVLRDPEPWTCWSSLVSAPGLTPEVSSRCGSSGSLSPLGSLSANYKRVVWIFVVQGFKPLKKKKIPNGSKRRENNSFFISTKTAKLSSQVL